MTPSAPQVPDPDRSQDPLREADRLFKAGDYPAALDRYEAVIALNPEAPVSLLVRGALLARLKKPREAILYCDKHLEFFPRDPEGWKLKGRLAYAEGLHRESLTAIERALQLTPDDVDLLLFKGYLLADIFQEYERAVGCYEAALRLRPRDPAIWIRKGRALHNLDRFKKAIACYNRALRLDGKNAETWKDKGDTLNCLALGGKALACYRRAIRLDPTRAAFWHIAALTHDDLGQSRKSRYCFQRVIEFGTPEERDLVNEARIALAEEEASTTPSAG